MILWLMVLLCASATKAQFLSFHGDSRSHGMANVRTIMADNWSPMINPAGLAGITSVSAGLFYENYYQIAGLGMEAVALALPTKSGNFGFGFIRFGYSQYFQSQASLSYGKNVGKSIRAGIGMHYIKISQPLDYGNLFAIIPSLGIQWLLLKKMTIGIQVINPANQHYLPSGSHDIPVILNAGFSYQFDKEVLFCMEIEKSSADRMRYSVGFEMLLLDKLYGRIGISSSDLQRYSVGIGFKNNFCTIDMAITKHPVLQYNASVTLAFHIAAHDKSSKSI